MKISLVIIALVITLYDTAAGLSCMQGYKFDDGEKFVYGLYIPHDCPTGQDRCLTFQYSSEALGSKKIKTHKGCESQANCNSPTETYKADQVMQYEGVKSNFFDARISCCNESNCNN